MACCMGDGGSDGGSRFLAFSTSSSFGFGSAWKNCFKVIGVTLGLDRVRQRSAHDRVFWMCCDSVFPGHFVLWLRVINVVARFCHLCILSGSAAPLPLSRSVLAGLGAAVQLLKDADGPLTSIFLLTLGNVSFVPFLGFQFSLWPHTINSSQYTYNIYPIFVFVVVSF